MITSIDVYCTERGKRQCKRLSVPLIDTRQRQQDAAGFIDVKERF